MASQHSALLQEMTRNVVFEAARTGKASVSVCVGGGVTRAWVGRFSYGRRDIARRGTSSWKWVLAFDNVYCSCREKQ